MTDSAFLFGIKSTAWYFGPSFLGKSGYYIYVFWGHFFVLIIFYFYASISFCDLGFGLG